MQYLKFDKHSYYLYITTTVHTRIQSAHTTFLQRKHHGLHIPYIPNQQLKIFARELDVRLKISEPLHYKAYSHVPDLLHSSAITIIHITSPTWLEAISTHIVYTFVTSTNLSFPTSSKLFSVTYKHLLFWVSYHQFSPIPTQRNSPSTEFRSTRTIFTDYHELNNSLTSFLNITTTRSTIIPHNHQHLQRVYKSNEINTILTNTHYLYLIAIFMYIFFVECRIWFYQNTPM